MNPSNGRWALMSTGDLERLRLFFRGVREQGCETKGVVVAPMGARERIGLAGLDWPRNWTLHVSGPLWTPQDEWFGLLWDDQCPEMPKWDLSLVVQAHPWRVVTSSEAAGGDWRMGATVWGVPCLEAAGGLDFEDLDQSLIAWSLSAQESRCWYIEGAVVIPRHLGPARREFSTIADPKMVAAQKDLMAAHKVQTVNPNWTGVSLMISTPSMASRPEALYTTSLLATLRMLEQQKVSYQWTLERFNADIGLARSHMFSEFVRSNHTHFLMIDDDMTWETSAVHRLIHANKPLVAVAGPKKRYPLTFAASHVDATGKPCPLTIEPDTGAAEVSHVGGAFMMIRRDCAEAIVKAHPELEYVGADGKICWGVFVQGVLNRAYLAEDFSFCQRYRKLGGKVYICPDVALGHIGSHEFKGDLLSNALKQAAPVG